MLTRARISYDLHNTPYKYDVCYEKQTVTYHFSSELYRSKFNERLYKSRSEISESLSKRFNVNICSDILADLRLYSSIEKRGYLISIDGEFVECQNNITLDGLKMTIKSFSEQ